MKKTLLIAMLFSINTLFAQFSVSSWPTVIGNNGQSGNAFELVTTSAITITDINCSMDAGAQNIGIWYRPGGNLHPSATAPAVSAANGWVLHETVSLTGTNGGATANPPGPDNVPFTTPLVLTAGTYGMAVLMTTGTGVNYQSVTAPTSFTDGIVTINVGTGKGWGLVSAGTGSFTPRAFVGSINYTLPSSPDDAGIEAIVSPVSDCDGSTQDVDVVVKNNGINQIANVDIHWTVNSVAQPTFSYNQLLDTANGAGPNSDTVTIGSLNLVGGNNYDIVAWTEDPNNQTDTVNYNDTSNVTVQGYNFPSVNLGLDTTTCPNDIITLNAGGGRDSVFWDNGNTNATQLADTARTYVVEVWKNGCPGGDTINISFYPAPPPVNLGNDTMICYGDSIILDATAPGVSYLWHDGSPFPTYIADTVGNYSVVIEDVNTCKSSDDINVSLFGQPAISMSVVPRNNICFGSPFEFRASSFTQGSTMYQWKINTVNAGAPTTNNKFSPTLTYGDSVNVDLITDVCSASPYSIASNYITMFINPEPKLISGSAATDTVLENTSKNYLVPITTGSTFTWSAVGGSITSPIGNAVSVDWGGKMDTARILVTEKDAGNCSYTNVRNVYIGSIVGIKDEGNQLGVGNAYPNPANTSVTIPLISDGNWKIDLSLYDMTGKKVKAIYNGDISGNRDFTFAVDDLENGMYFYKVSTEDGYESVKKISIQH